ncbi:3-oxoacyl-[acyl-carrier-protein] synthase 2 [Pirellulimonas nuda]|uniref:3-oxoacyl-[acyl-carrier-protein] synthase 2 n=1 Tax=Pirellulimonas nuda TaxID=2528009 RepID=A0A518D7V5_9BACT|nr:beta-ketoacyl synthase N-terminal-like domain-containing protein [Pirellulimonas nuda]QDU87539.1 3-oxoacyl-[acyl-carrier-protein] synthase 2 [Pirellulimonas nuda]
MSNPSQNARRVVVTGFGQISPLGSTPQALADALAAGQSVVTRTAGTIAEKAPYPFVAAAPQFTGEIDDFGPLEGAKKKAIRKGLKLMCRETQMAVAAAQHALADAGFAENYPDPERAGVVLGSDYMMTLPEDYLAGIVKILEGEAVNFSRWGEEGLDEMQPLWMLKYLPNMPASHIAIYNDLRGPNNSLTMRESSGLMAIGEAMRTIARGHADMIVAGATGTRVMPMQAIHAWQSEEVAHEGDDPHAVSRPFDRDRCGAVLGESSAMLVLESLESARARGARVLGEVLGFGSSQATGKTMGANIDQAIANACRAALSDAGLDPGQVGHINSHGLSGPLSDRFEAQGIARVFGDPASQPPLIAIKSYQGNVGAASGVVELIASLLAFGADRLPRVLNYETPDPDCPVRPVTTDDQPAGCTALKISSTPQGQVAAVCIGAAPV